MKYFDILFLVFCINIRVYLGRMSFVMDKNKFGNPQFFISFLVQFLYWCKLIDDIFLPNNSGNF